MYVTNKKILQKESTSKNAASCFIYSRTSSALVHPDKAPHKLEERISSLGLFVLLSFPGQASPLAVLRAVEALEALNTELAPTSSPLLDGEWSLLFTASAASSSRTSTGAIFARPRPAPDRHPTPTPRSRSTLPSLPPPLLHCEILLPTP